MGKSVDVVRVVGKVVATCMGPGCPAGGVRLEGDPQPSNRSKKAMTIRVNNARLFLGIFDIPEGCLIWVRFISVEATVPKVLRDS